MRHIRTRWGKHAGELAALLHDDIQTYRSAAGQLAPVQIVVSHRAMRQWLTLELAALGGGCGHLRFRSLEFLCSPDQPRWVELCAELFEILDDAWISSQAVFAPLQNFLARERANDLRALRRYRLAERLARVFLRYQAHWPEGLRRWERGESTESEAWQAALWRTLRERTGGDEEGRTREDEMRVKRITHAGPIFLFDLFMPHQDVTEALRQLTHPVTLLLRSGPPETRIDKRLDASLDDHQPGCVGGAGHVWHRHGTLRTQGNRLCLRGIDFEWNEQDALQTHEEPTLPSVEVVPAPSLRRACEHIVASIWSWVRAASSAVPLRFHEVAVVIPRACRDAYLPTLREVMHEGHALPHVLWNLPQSKSHPMAHLIRLLVELPQSRLRRDHVLAIFRHPLYRAWLGEESGSTWSDWLDSVGVFQGIDDEDLKSTYLAEEPAFHWDQGLTRLALGAFMDADDDGAPTVMDSPNGAFEVAERNPAAHEELASWVGMTRSLLADAARLRDAELSVSAWAELIRCYLGTYLPQGGRYDGEVRAYVDGLTHGIEQSGLRGEVPYLLVQTMMLDSLDVLPANGGDKLTHGVVIASPEDMHGVPFRLLVFLGLDAAHFPAGRQDAELDLRPSSSTSLLDCRVDQHRAHDALVLYESIRDATDGVSLCFIAKDAVSGEPQQPSLLIHDLMAYARELGSEVVTRQLPDRRDLLFGDVGEKAEYAKQSWGGSEAHEHEVSGGCGTDDASAMEWAFPEAKYEAACRVWADGYRRKFGAPPGWGGTTQPWAEAYGVPPLRTETRPPGSVVQVSLDDLAMFLQCPVQGYARHHLRMRGESEDRGALGEEPLESSALIRARVFRDVFGHVLQTVPPNGWSDEPQVRDVAARAYDATLARMSRRGEIPRGFLGGIQISRQLRELEKALHALLSSTMSSSDLPGAQMTARKIHWGMPSAFHRELERGTDSTLVPVKRTLDLPDGPALVHVVGSSPWLLFGGALSLSLLSSFRTDAVTTEWKQAIRDRALLRGWVAHLLHRCGEEPAQSGRDTHRLVAFGFDGLEHARVIQALPQSKALQILDSLLLDFLQERPSYRCPAVIFLRRGDELRDEVPWAERVRIFSDDCKVVYKAASPVEQTQHAVVRGIPELPEPNEHELSRAHRRISWFRRAIAGEDLDGGGGHA